MPRRDLSFADNFYRRQAQSKISAENTKMFIKLVTIKSDLM